MFIYDRRRIATPDAEAWRARLTVPQAARVTELESSGWHLHFVRDDDGDAMLVRGQEAIAVRTDGSWALGGDPLRASDRDAASRVDEVFHFEGDPDFDR